MNTAASAQNLSSEDRAEALIALCDEPSITKRDPSGTRIISHRERWSGLVTTFRSLVAAGAPRRELASAWSYDLEPCIALTAAIDWAKAKHHGTLVLSGSVGRGKTVAAARYALSTMAAWCHAPLLALDEWSSAAKRVEALLESHHLVMDEVGGPGTTTGMAVARISAILSARHAAERPTIVTTNLPEQEFAKIYDGVESSKSRLIDRINDAGSWITCKRDAVHASFRADGGCSYAKNRYADAKRNLDLLRAAESGDHRSLVLDDLQTALQRDDGQLREALAAARSQRSQLANVLERMIQGSSFSAHQRRTQEEAS